ncbi:MULTISPECIES: hypothetical protein [Paenibacillus]|uniref:hypothetical protein n=1 Tax=Paenibacillus TaxID=44249 RepID=UPI00249BB8FB|nr:hypothetical protein [Paenibacillus amylolyticus]WFA85651.1 hypothetical protein OGI70_01560 [Paenibacillus amylolyticus]
MVKNNSLKKFIVIVFTIALLSLLLDSISPRFAEAKCTYVSGYTKKNGTRVSGYYRGCGTTDNNSSYKPYVPTYTQDNNYFGLSNTVNLYKGNNYVGNAEIENLVYVNGYYRKDGTYVRPHYRTHPNNYINDNFSYLGISSLVPHTKYPSFIFNTNQDISLKESYLLYSLAEHNLNQSQLKTLKNYAENLNEVELNKELEQKSIIAGKQFYTSLGYDDTTAYNKTRFDLSGNLSIEDYLFNVTYNFNPSSKEVFGDFPMLETYAYLLNESRTDLNLREVTKKYGKRFYTFVGADNLTIENQIEMDLIQPFETNPSSIPLMPPTETKKQSIKSYLMSESTHHGIIFNSQVSFDIINYQNSLESLYNGSSSNFTFSLSEGIKFYTKHGLNVEGARNQTIKDINIILAS